MNTLPSGWMAKSPVATAYLLESGFNINEKLVPQLLNRNGVVWYVLATDEELEEIVFDPFLNYLNRHYGSSAAQERLSLEVLTSKSAGKESWVFFEIN